jgi:putative Mn2+ efflux pump MntP
MSWFDLTGLCFGFGISLFASACALGTGLVGLSRFRVCQLSWNLAILQFALLVAGWLLGVEATHHAGVWVVWADTVFVLLVAIKMFWLGQPSHVPGETSGVDRTMTLLGMTTNARILVLAWGFVLASLTIHQGSIGLLAGTLAFMLTGVGILAGYRFGVQVPRGPKWAGACALLLIAAHMQASLLLWSQ